MGFLGGEGGHKTLTAFFLCNFKCFVRVAPGLTSVNIL